ncbi:LysR family transcriptional regulator [Epibacterium sp. Ofav1-8]|uniref:LysR family transcriptional regulator n=1 Tax=Epibacterium sp. Ofav1-8 TaxID=2917735 RepID=UPI001EF489C5|nr:LysR family transcriptional regulator [Epibacterium sp. Ofav1-8]MCG7624358.1 LysR family transcriptional regulator [Epibacterium sp. Ofav1-8]
MRERTMMQDLPPLNYLRSFEAAARMLSFTEAARELHLTQAAVSGHIRALEQHIGGPLFVRHPRSLTLTSLGNAYLSGVQQALQQVQQATHAILRRRGAERVVISCPVSLVDHWLADLVARFGVQHPGAAVTIHGRVWVDEPPEIADIILTNVHEETLDRASLPLWRDQLVAVCAPSYQAQAGGLSGPQDLPRARLIHSLGRTDVWPQVFRSFGLPVAAADPGAEGACQANTFGSVIALAEAGQGVAVVPGVFARAGLAAGRLMAPLGQVGPCPWVCTLSDSSLLTSDAARALHRFIQAEATSAPPVLNI